VSTEPSGAACFGGGIKLEVGLDNGDGVGSTARDGTLQSGEVDQTSYVCNLAPKRVFVTSTTHAGSFGGITAGNNLCQGLATTEGLSGTYFAWIATAAATDPESRFTRSPTGYALVDGTLVATSWADLIDSALAGAINLTESGAAPPTVEAWTGVAANGTGNVNDCTNWTVTTGTGVAGTTAATDGTWTSLASRNCTEAKVLYCFEQ
jgi:hypothetical protein